MIFFLIYGLMNLWFILCLNKAFPALPGGWILPVFFCLAMIQALFLTRTLERDGKELAASLSAYIGYSWMGFLFLFISVSGLLILFKLLWKLPVLSKYYELAFLTPRSIFLFSAITCLLICIYGWFEAGQLKVEQHQISTSKLTQGSPSIKIAMISDLHIGLIVGCRQVQQLVDRIEAEKPDLLVATGDIVDGHIKHFDGIAEKFSSLNLPLGLVAVPGNHEYYAGIGESLRFLKQAGYQVLRDETLLLGQNLVLVGMDDPAAIYYGNKAGDETGLLRSVPTDRFILLLKHRPITTSESIGLFDLQLSGHVHKGQIFPFNLLTWLQFPVKSGMNRLDANSLLYVSRGTGTWGPPIRFLAPPELTLFELVPQ